ncbi:MAG: ABC transporter ATP-binding protein [Clostridia bacterium]|nr:ABC transporter ATP-binding protein [Clostridia bacterium]
MLKITNLHKTFNPGTVNAKKALNGLNLTIEDGEFVTVIGGNGAGKSTLLNAICGVWKPDFGTVEIDGVDVTNMPEHKRAKFLGRVFQDPMKGTAPDMEIAENLSIAARRGTKRKLVRGVRRAEREEYKKMLATLELGLEDRLSSKVGLLSGGQRQAVTLLMATLQRPKLLMLDEHTAALDPKTAAKVLEITDKIVNENKLTTLMITHNMYDAIAHGNRLIMLYDGQVVVDVRGEEKKKLTVEDLLGMFAKASGKVFSSDRALLN